VILNSQKNNTKYNLKAHYIDQPYCSFKILKNRSIYFTKLLYWLYRINYVCICWEYKKVANLRLCQQELQQ